ncbi:unnamed protein product, partial [Mesorhabditis spiculigera]
MIAESSISWEELEAAMNSAFSVKTRIGPRRSVKRIGEGNGFLSTIYRIDLDWQGSEDGGKTPPKTCALKVSSLGVVEDLFEIIGSSDKKHLKEYYARSMADNELFFYSKIGEFGLERVRTPRFYCGRKFDGKTSFLAMELLEKASICHIYDMSSEAQILAVLDQCAMVNGKSLSHVETIAKCIDAGFYDQLVEDFNTKEKTAAGILRLMERFLRTRNIILRSGKRIARSTCCAKEISGPPNVMWKKEGNEADLMGILDWQLVHLGNPLEDVFKWISLTIQPEDYTSRRDFYLKFYYEALLRYADGKEIPWSSLEEFISAFELMYVWQTALYCRIVANTGDMLFDGMTDSEKEPLKRLYHGKFFKMLDEAARIIDLRAQEIL